MIKSYHVIFSSFLERALYAVIELAPNRPYSFKKITNKILQTPQPSKLYRLIDGKLTRTITHKEEIYIVTISNNINGNNTLLMEIIPNGNATYIDEVIHLTRHVFGIDVEMEGIDNVVSVDEQLQHAIRPFYEIRIVQDSNLFESLVNIIIGQQLNLSFAGTLTERLIEQYGTTIKYQGVTLPVFPTPSQLAKATIEELRELQFSQRKAEYIIEVAKGVTNGDIDLESLRKMENATVIEYLTKIRGIGRWTAENLLLFGLGRKDVLPAADIGLRNAIKKVYGLNEKPTEEEVRRIGEAWTPWSSYITYYLWEALNDTDK